MATDRQQTDSSISYSPVQHVGDCFSVGTTTTGSSQAYLQRINDRLIVCAVYWIEQCFMSPPTQYRLYGRRFLQVKRPNQQYQSTEGTHTVHQ